MTGIIESTVYLSVTALVILLFKWIFKNKLSAKWHVWIWALLAVRLVLPSLPESSFSIFNAFDIPEKETAEIREEFETIKDETMAEPITEIHSGTDVEKEISRKSKSVDSIINIVRFSGSGLLLVYFLAIYIICVKRVSKNKSGDSESEELLQECKRRVGVKRRVSIIRTGNSPMLMGLVKPSIILPDGYTEEENKNIIIHELCHLKGGDIYLLWVAMIVLCLNWFNPIMWLCFFLFRRDIEVYCDERVLKYIDSKKNYASLLVKTALKKNSFIAGTTSLQNGEKEVERRVKYMAYFKKPNLWWTVLIIVVAVVVAVVCLTNPVNGGDDEGKSNINDNNVEVSVYDESEQMEDEEIIEASPSTDDLTQSEKSEIAVTDNTKVQISEAFKTEDPIPEVIPEPRPQPATAENKTEVKLPEPKVETIPEVVPEAPSVSDENEAQKSEPNTALILNEETGKDEQTSVNKETEIESEIIIDNANETGFW